MIDILEVVNWKTEKLLVRLVSSSETECMGSNFSILCKLVICCTCIYAMILLTLDSMYFYTRERIAISQFVLVGCKSTTFYCAMSVSLCIAKLLTINRASAYILLVSTTYFLIRLN